MTDGAPADPALVVHTVHRDEALLVLDKPPGIPTTTPDAGPSLVALARELDPLAPHLHASSRLDAQVSGLVTFARTRAANAGLLRARAEGSYGRAYLAIALHAPTPQDGHWDWSLGIDPRDRRRRVAAESAVDGAGLRRASTTYRTLSITQHAALLWLEPHTGRTHQLRVHCQQAGCAILGDIHYGGTRRVVLQNGAVIAPRRVMLHCTRLSLPDLATGVGKLSLQSLPREDFRRIWDLLGGTPIETCVPA